MLKISDFAEDTATTTVTYRKHKVEFTFRPGAYTGELARDAQRAAEVIAKCVTEWNVDSPLTVEELEKLPAGLIAAVYDSVRDLSMQAGLGEAPANSPTG